MNMSDKLYTMGDHLVSNFYTFVVICVDGGYFGNSHALRHSMTSPYVDCLYVY